MTALRAHISDDLEPIEPAEPAAKETPPDSANSKTRPARTKTVVEPAVYTADDIQVLIGVSPITLDRMILGGEFPSPFTPRRKKRRWLRRTVDEWIESTANERGGRRRR